MCRKKIGDFLPSGVIRMRLVPVYPSKQAATICTNSHEIDRELVSLWFDSPFEFQFRGAETRWEHIFCVSKSARFAIWFPFYHAGSLVDFEIKGTTLNLRSLLCAVMQRGQIALQDAVLEVFNTVSRTTTEYLSVLNGALRKAYQTPWCIRSEGQHKLNHRTAMK